MLDNGSHATQDLVDHIARLSIDTYTALPSKCKPVIRSNGVTEWTIMASIVLVVPLEASDKDLMGAGAGVRRDVEVKIISMGTGMKCLPYNRLPPAGDTLHDHHAEVLAKRGFRRWLLDTAGEIRAMKMGKRYEHHLLHVSKDGRIGLRGGVQVWMYVSTLPCGGASTTFTAAYQPIDMAELKSRSGTPFQQSSPRPNSNATLSASNILDQGLMRGRNNYSEASSLRTKPGRTDSFPSISLSCSDKICSWSVLGLQGALLSNARIPLPIRDLPVDEVDDGQGSDAGLVSELHFDPVYLDGIVIGDVVPPTLDADDMLVGWRPDQVVWEEKVRSFREAVKVEAEWALSGRIQGIAEALPPPFRIVQPCIAFTDVSFPYSKLALTPASSPTPSDTRLSETDAKEAAPMINSLLYLPYTDRPTTEVLYQGADSRQLWKPPGIVPLPEKRRSKVCKLEMMRAVQRLSGVDVPEEAPRKKSRRVIAEQEAEGGLARHLGSISISEPGPASGTTYRQLKDTVRPTPASGSHGEYVSTYQIAKRILRGAAGPKRLVPSFERCGPLGVTVADQEHDTHQDTGDSGILHRGHEVGSTRLAARPPFVGWITTGAEWESFDVTGASQPA